MALTQSQIRDIIKLRGFGYRESEISSKLNISRKTVSNHLQRLKGQAEIMKENGMHLDDIFARLYFG